MPITKIKSTDTYREAIQNIIGDLQDIYDQIGVLRDCASHNEKEAYNNARGLLHSVWGGFQKLDNTITRERADTKIAFL